MLSKEELQIIFESEFNAESWKRVLLEVFGLKRYQMKPQEVGVAPNEWDAKGYELGDFATIEGRLVGVYEVKINKAVKLQYSKVGLRNLLKPIYKNNVDAALVVFNQGKQWRFSYVSEIRVTNKETGKRETKETDPKRYTYLFGEGQKCRTPAERFSTIQQQYNLFGGGIKLEEIEKAFSVDSLTKDFYRELSDWYFRALKEVGFPDDADRIVLPNPTEDEREKEEKTRNATSTIRLITRLIFVWFLKQKGLVPDELFDKPTIDTLINYKDKTGSTYYKAILQNLFFATLNTEMGDNNRKFVDRQYGIQGYYRYKRFFKNAERFLDLTKNIPFLNGGLFENLDKNVGSGDEVRIDCFSNAKENEERLKVPDSLFFAEETVDLSGDYGDKKKKAQKVRGLINILQGYNFTIEENTPFEIEVALDPELLGKVFENLLASYVPETETTARKMTGSFYTPREIVDYMVDESLKAYLSPFLSEASEDKLNRLFSYTNEEIRFTEREKQTLIKALDSANILDPACGSGAFPMGVLHKMVMALTKLDPANQQWRELQREKALVETEEAYKLGNKEEREQRLLDISEAFEENSDDYGRKLFLIENCIYGVDIQPIAVQIAKLRFFISLIVDQQITDNKRNLGVRPLPNLETKFVAANTLIGLNKPKQLLLRNPKIEELEKELNSVRHKHFSARTPKSKERWRKKDEELREQIGELLKYDGWDNETAELVAHWNPYNQNQSSSFFDSEWMYGIEGGFDIIIGNPPYMSLQRMDSSTEPLKKAGYKTFEKTGDLYSLFYEQGINLLKADGVLCYISSNKWINANYGKSTRKFFATATNPLILIDFAKVRIFEAATVFVNILLTQKAKNHNLLQACTIEGDELPNEDLREYFDKHKTVLKDLDENIWKVNKSTTNNINSYIEKKGTRLKDWKDVSFFRGITSGLNEAFHITKEQKEELENLSLKNADIIKPLLRGKDIKRWGYEFEDKYMLFIPWHFPQHNDSSITNASAKAENEFRIQYPDIYSHLLRFKEDLSNRNQTETGIRYEWYALQRYGADFWENFELPKIVWIEISDRANYAYDESGMFLTNSAYFMTGKHLKYVLAVLNSKVADYYFFQITATIAGGRKRYTGQYVEQVPVPQISEDDQKPFIKIVDYILLLKTFPDDQESRIACNHFEAVLEAMVFELYFQELIKDAMLDVIKNVSELPTLFEGSSQEKLKLVKELYKKTYAKESPIRNSLFFLDTIPEIKEINEALAK